MYPTQGRDPESYKPLDKLSSAYESEQEKRLRLERLEQQKQLKKLLPYKYAFRDYLWSREFIESRNRMCLITAANQIGKSTSLIRKMIMWAIEKELWPELWETEPNLFWYLYPDKNTATQEFETKWKLLLPHESLKNDPKYGWEEFYEHKKIHSIKFNSGVLLMFKTYAQDVHNLQAGTVYFIGCDEELPWELYDEFRIRRAAVRGYFATVFTATKGQEFWRLAMEEQGTRYEKFPQAQKWQISLYDCQTFVDGISSHITDDYIEEQIAECSSEAEVQKRVFGKFVLTEGLKYENFSIKKNCRAGGNLPLSWTLYPSIDYGSGGEKGHPAAIVFLAVNSDYTKGRVFRAWRGDGITTDASIIMEKYREMHEDLEKEGYRIMPSQYDYAAADLYTVGSRLGFTLIRADKSHERGEGVLNSLFKHEVLSLDEDQPEVMKLAFELTGLRKDEDKRKSKDDLTDATRYAAIAVPWNWAKILPKSNHKKVVEEKPKTELQHRRNREADFPEDPEEQMQAEFDEWNELYG